MTIESATYINTLNSSLPAATDPKSEGDDHIRLVKAVLKATFPNVAGAISPADKASNNTFTGANTFNGDLIKGGYSIRLQGASALTNQGLINSEVEIGGDLASWTGAGVAALQVSCYTAAATYIGIRWTRWGTRHLGAIGIYEGGSSTSTVGMYFMVGSNPRQFILDNTGAMTSVNSSSSVQWTITSSGSLVPGSSEQYKTNVTPVDSRDSLSKVQKLKFVSFDYTPEYGGEHRDIGITIQQIEPLVPEYVRHKLVKGAAGMPDAEGVFAAEDVMLYDALKALQQLAGRVVSLEALVAKLQKLVPGAGV